jgi:hypothetical protein
VSGAAGLLVGVELYVVPGADAWSSGPGAQIGAAVPARAGVTHEVRMYAAKVPSEEFELSVSLRPGPRRSIAVGESIRFHFDSDDIPCDSLGGRCRSYLVAAAVNGAMDVVLKAVSRTAGSLQGIEVQVSPGGGVPAVGPGPRMNLTAAISAGTTYEIRLYSRLVPSEDLELTVAIVRDPLSNFPTIAVGQPIRFRFGTEDACPSFGIAGCRSYVVTAPSDGQMKVDLTAVSGDARAVIGLELYVVPGADYWDTGPGARIGAVFSVRAGNRYEIRMSAAHVPTEELELAASYTH